MSEIGFLATPEPNSEAQRLFDDDTSELGYVMNASRLWAYQPAVLNGLFDLMRQATSAHRLTLRERGILVAACASTFGDSYCSLAWGSKLAGASDPRTAAAVIRGDDDPLGPQERAMARWARKVARDPSHTTSEDVQELRAAGLGDAQIFAITVFVGMRMAFSTVNDALGVRPDAAYRSSAPEAVLEAVTFGRPIEDEPVR
ncbi:MAG: carboxymuconolactone decarboxylase family protein [Candidatus Dormibacteria bacterium]